MENEMIAKNYMNDIYLMLPLADNPRNWRMDDHGVLEKARASAKADYADVPNAFTRKLLNSLREYLAYECSNVVVSELDMAYLGEYDFLHSTDDYPGKNEQPQVVGVEKCHLILTVHANTNMYVLTVVLPMCGYDTTQVLDQLSQESLWIRKPEDARDYLQTKYKTSNIPEYVSLYEYIKHKYGLLKCGEGKAFVLLSEKPSDEVEFRCMMAGETYGSQHQDFHIASERINEICNTNYAQYDYYEVYMSDKIVACIMEDFSEDEEERIDLTATYAFIVVLVMFQNTSIVKTNMQITNALANDGDISHQQILSLYRNFGKTVRFWEKDNFKYWGTQAEAACIRAAFGNDELKQTYYEHQEFLEHIVELKAAQVEERNSTTLNIVATVLAVIQVQGFAVNLLAKFYQSMGIEIEYASSTFSTMVVCGALSFVVILMIINRMRDKMRKGSMHIKELRDEDE